MHVRSASIRQLIAATALCAAAVSSTWAADREPSQVQSALSKVIAARDNGGRPFAIIDKKHARLYVYNAHGELMARTAVLLGAARGDASVPGIGERKMADIKPYERTTPAGRFRSEPGRNLQGEDIVWIDYDAAVSMHRVRGSSRAERRLERLASPTPADNRISYGCVNVPADFYDQYVKPAFGSTEGVIYILPEMTAS